jgi:hypothetical protein
MSKEFGTRGWEGEDDVLTPPRSYLGSTKTPTWQEGYGMVAVPVPPAPAAPVDEAKARKVAIRWAVKRLGKTADEIAENLSRRGFVGDCGVPRADPLTRMLQARFGPAVWLEQVEAGSPVVVLLDTAKAAFPLGHAVQMWFDNFQLGLYPGLVRGAA